jgi:hypothetical protein
MIRNEDICDDRYIEKNETVNKFNQDNKNKMVNVMNLL